LFTAWRPDATEGVGVTAAGRSARAKLSACRSSVDNGLTILCGGGGRKAFARSIDRCNYANEWARGVEIEGLRK